MDVVKEKIRQLEEQSRELQRTWMRMHDAVCMLGIQQDYHDAFRGMMKLHWAISDARMHYNREVT